MLHGQNTGQERTCACQLADRMPRERVGLTIVPVCTRTQERNKDGKVEVDRGLGPPLDVAFIYSFEQLRLNRQRKLHSKWQNNLHSGLG